MAAASNSNDTKWEDIRAATDQLNAAVAGLAGPGAPGEHGEAGNPDKTQYQKIVEAAQKVLAAAKDPAGMGMEAIGQLSVITANRIFWEWGVFDEIPATGTISYAELAKKVEADVSLLGETLLWPSHSLTSSGPRSPRTLLLPLTAAYV